MALRADQDVGMPSDMRSTAMTENVTSSLGKSKARFSKVRFAKK
jgi:hypothetical protein